MLLMWALARGTKQCLLPSALCWPPQERKTSVPGGGEAAILPNNRPVELLVEIRFSRRNSGGANLVCALAEVLGSRPALQ